MNAKEEVYKVAKDHVDMITGRDNMRILMTAEVCTVEELIDCLEAFKTHDGSNNYLRSKQDNGFLVEQVEAEMPNGKPVTDIRLTEME